MRHHINKMAWFVWITVVLLTVLFALFVTFLRIVTPMLQNYTEQIKEYLTHGLHHPVHIGEIKSDWYGFGPVIEIKELAIFDNDEKTVLLSAKYARLRFSLFELLRHLSLVPASLSIEQGAVTLNYSQSKHWSVAGINNNPDTENQAASIFEWVPARQRINFHDFTINVHVYSGEEMKFEHVNAFLADDGSTMNLQIAADWTAPLTSKLNVIAEFDSQRLARGELDGKLYTHLSAVDWDTLALFGPHLPENIKVKQNSGSLEFWIDWLRGDIKGVVKVDSHDVSLEMNDIFSEPVHLSQVNAEVGWEKNQQGWTVTANHLNILPTPTEKVVVRGVIKVPAAPEASPEVEVLATVPSIELNNALDFVPDKKLSPKFVEWLDQAFKKGRLENATVVIRGPWNAFPFDNGEGKFEIHAFLADTTLSYHPLCPPVEDIQAELVFSGRRMDATILSGTLTGSQIQRSVISIPYIGSAQPMVVLVPGSLTGTANSGMDFLRKSPLWEKLGTDLSALQFNGPITVDLDLAFPLGQPDVPPTVYGTIGLDKAQVVIPELDLSFNDVVGVLGFSDKAVTAHNLKAELLGEPVEVDVDTVAQVDQPDYLQFRVEGTADPSALVKRYPDPIWSHMKGHFNYSAVLERHHAPDPQGSWFLLTSDLKGVAFDLPPPLGKKASDAGDFSYRTSVGEPGRTEVQAHYDDKLAAHLEFASKNKNQTGLKRGTLVLNSGAIPNLVAESGLQVNGKLEYLSLDDWVPFTADYIKERAKLATAATVETNVRAKLEVPVLEFAQHRFATQFVEARGNKNIWQFYVEGHDIGGGMTLPSDLATQRLTINLDHFYWINSATVVSEGKEAKPTKFKPEDLPATELTIDHLYIGDRLLGQFHIVTDKTPMGLQFRDLLLKTDDYTITAEGQWTNQNGIEQFGIGGKVKTPDLGKALAYWGYHPDIKEAKATMKFDWAWPGGPMNFSLKSLVGESELKIENGRILDINPGGFGRILSLVNLDSLQRRLRLDFSDVLEKGFTFDEMTGHFTLQNGLATTNDTMVSSSATKIAVKGDTDFVHQTFDLRIIVMPHLTGPLPIAAAIAVNPLVGVGVWVADKILGPQIQQLTQYWYSVTGPWTAPKVESMERESPSRKMRQGQ